MNCSGVSVRLSAFLEGDLSPRDERRVAAHLDACGPCRADLDTLRRTVRMLRSLPDPDVPPDFAALVAEQIAREEASALARLRGMWLQALSAPWLAPAGAAALGLAVFWWVQALDGSLATGVAGNLAPLGAGGVPRLVRVAPPTPPPAEARMLAIARAEAPAPAAPRPSVSSCIPGRPSGAAADPEDCAAWYAWFVGLAVEDAPGFLAEVDQLPTAQRDPWLRELSSFAARSGSAALVGRRLRSSADPRATPVAHRFERSVAPDVRPVGFRGR